VIAGERVVLRARRESDRPYARRWYTDPDPDATRTLCRYAFSRLNLARVSLTVFPENAAARRVYDRLGFVAEGVQRQAFWKRGAWHDLLHLAVFPETLR
jgi:RimJ/RimL family protein N-acetyltransferase